MNIYHWIVLILALDVALVLFVRGADERQEARQKKYRHLEAQQ